MVRYSLKTLGAVVALIAVACAALLNANVWIASTAWTVLFFLLTTATILAVLARPERRGFWTGFALAGWLYLLAGIGPLAGDHRNLLTSLGLHRAASLLPQENTQTAATNINVVTSGTVSFANSYLVNTIPGNVNQTSGWVTTYPYPLTQVSAAPQPYQSVVDIGQSLWTLLLALAGGWFGAMVVARRHVPQTAPESSTQS